MYNNLFSYSISGSITENNQYRSDSHHI